MKAMHAGKSEGMNHSIELQIREFCKADREQVINLCLTHYKSLALPSVRYYCENHYFEIFVLITMGLFQTTFLNVVLNFCIFAIYLFVRALLELKEYCRVNCNDLQDVEGFYSSKDDAKFYVADLNGTIVGVGGIRRSRFHDPKDAQILRLVVDATCRRMRIGSRLLSTMEIFAEQYGYERIFLNTSNLTKSHIKFINVNGYTMTACIPRNCMRGDLLKWRKILKPQNVKNNFPINDVEEQNVY